MRRRQADGRVDGDVLGGAVGREDPHVGLGRERGQRSRAFGIPSETLLYLPDERLEEVGLVPQRVVDQAVAEGHHAVGEVVLREPGHHPLLLHVGTARHVHDQVAQVLPVPAGGGGGKVPVSPTPAQPSPAPCLPASSGTPTSPRPRLRPAPWGRCP